MNNILLSETDNGFLKTAISLASDNVRLGLGGPFGAVVVHNGQVISTGVNRVTTTNDPTAHAEVVAIREACTKLGNFSLHGCTIYSSCEPCPMCLSAIYWARIDRIFFSATRHQAAEIGFDDEFLYKEIALPLENRKIPVFGIYLPESGQVFEEWANKPNKIAY